MQGENQQGQETPEVILEDPVVADTTPEDQETAPVTPEEQKPVDKTFTQAELDAIVQKRVAKAEAKAARQIERTYRETLERIAPQPTKPVATEISRDNYATDADWIDAKVEARLAERDRQSQQVQQQQEFKRIEQTTEQIYAKAEKETGFDREAFEELPLTPAIASAIIESDVAPKLMAYMTSNPEEVDRIARLSPTRQAVELGKLEVKLTAAPKTSAAPAPITPIGSGRTAVHDLANASPEDYYLMRQKQGARYFKR